MSKPISNVGNPGDNETRIDQPPPGARLVAQQGPEQGRSFPISPTGLLVGRAPECNLALNDAQVSRRHARFYWRGSRLIVEDLGSANGTSINGVPISAPFMLSEGDTVEIGNSVFVAQGLLSRELTPTLRNMETMPPPAVPRTVPPPPPTQANNRFWFWVIGLSLGLVALIALGGLIALWYLNQPAAVSQAAPSAVFIFPPNGAQVEVSQPVIVQAQASDSRGVTRLELWVNGVQAGQQVSASPQGESPLMLNSTWTPPAPGNHVLELRAFNTANQPSAPMLITVNAVPGPATATSEGLGTATPPPEPSPSPLPSPTSPAIILFTPTSPPTAAPQPVVQAVADVNVRGGPGTNYPILGLLRANDTAAAMGRSQDGAWWQISFPANTGGVGWVVGTYVQPNAAADNVPVVAGPPLPPTHTPAPPTPTNTPLPSAEVSFTADNTGLNQGQCTRLRWRVRNVAAYWVDGAAGVGDEGNKEVCDPVGTTTHTLRIQRQDGSTQDFTVTINIQTTTVPKPNLISPDDDIEFEDSDDDVDFVWSAVSAPGTVTYNLEIQYRDNDEWENWRTVNGLTNPNYRMGEFAENTRGRWRVWATSSTLGDSEKTGWRDFDYNN